MRHLKPSAFQSYVDCELSPKRRKRAERHIATCASCRKKLDHVRTARDLVRSRLDGIVPDRIPAPLSIDLLPAISHKDARSIFLGHVFAYVRVPSILLVLMASGIIVLSGLFFMEKRHQNEDLIHPASRKTVDVLNMISPGRQESISMPISLDLFKPIKNPNILIFKEDIHE